MSAFLARRWRQQPQGLLTVDRGHTLSTGLCAAWHPAARQYIGPGVATFPPDGTYAYQTDQSGGFGVKFNGAANSRIALPAGSAGFTTDYSGTRLVLFRANATTLGLVSGTVAGTIGMRLNGAVSQISLVSASNTVVGIGNVPVSTGPTIALCTANSASTETRLHINGQLTFSGAAGYTASNAGIWIGAITNHNSSSNFFLALSWDRALSLSEAAAIQENPWQIFLPQKSVAYSLPGTLFSALDETTSDQSDYIRTTSSGQVYETTLSPIQQPTGNIDINFDAESPLNTGGIKFEVFDGANLVRSQTVSFPSATSTFSITPSEYSVSSPSVGKFLPQRWKQQPRGSIRIDWGNTITRNLQVVLHPVHGRFYDVTRYAAANSLVNASIVSSPNGVGLNGVGVNADGGVTSQFYSFFPVAASYVVCGFSVDPYWHSLNYVSHSLGGYGGAANSSFLGVATDGYSSGRTVSFRLSTQNYDGSGAITFTNLLEQGKPFVYGATRVVGANGHRAFSSGRFLGSADGGTGGIGPYGGDVSAGNSTYYGSGNTILMVAYWDRALSDAEMVAATSEPWQIFKPNAGRIYGLPSTGVTFPWSPKLRITSL